MKKKHLLSNQQPIRVPSTTSVKGKKSNKISIINSSNSRSTTKSYEDLIRDQTQRSESGKPGSVAGPQEWQAAWKQKQIQQHLKNPLREDHTDPSPLLMDKISSLPADSAERRNAEVMKGILDNSTSNVGYGTDSLTRESYKDLKRLAKHSNMLQSSIEDPKPQSGQLVGLEQGTVVSNLQSWRPSVANAIQPVSDAIGSHADTNSSITKSALGPTQLLPQTALANAKNVSSSMVSEVENPMKGVQKGVLIQTPSKESGSLRHLVTGGNPKTSMPFDLVSDTYNGLMSMINKAAKAIDMLMNKIIAFAISALGGLMDALFPPGMLAKLIQLVQMILKLIHDLFALLGGFRALSNISNQILNNQPIGCTGNIFGLNRASSSSSSSSSRSKKSKALGSIVGGLPGIGNALGNLGVVFGPKKGSSSLGALTLNISHPEQLLDGLFDKVISGLLKKLHKNCNVGMVGNRGYSVGETFDSLMDNAFSVALQTYAAHASIISPNFNKKSTPIGSYATEASLDMFEQLPYGQSAQGSNGVIMHGPGGTQKRKVFRI